MNSQKAKAALWGAGYRLYSNDDPEQWIYEHKDNDRLMAITRFMGAGFLVTFYADIDSKPTKAQQLSKVLKLSWS